MKVKIPLKVKKEALTATKLKKIGYKGMLDTGLKRMKQLSNDDMIHLDDVIVMSNWFKRHKITSKPNYLKWKEQGKTCSWNCRNKYRGAVAYLGWGGLSAEKWLESNDMKKKITKYKSIISNKNYLPKTLSKKDRDKQIESIFYGKGRPKLRSFKSKKSKWTKKAHLYFNGDTSLENISKKLGDLSIKGMKEIMDKGEGAYFSSGSRPNQTKESWGRGRLYSVLFGGKSRQIDKDIVKKYKIPLLKL